MVEPLVARLEAADPWVALAARRDLLDIEPSDADRHAVADEPRVDRILSELETWPPARRSSRAYDPKDGIWKTAVLADFGTRPSAQARHRADRGHPAP